VNYARKMKTLFMFSMIVLFAEVGLAQTTGTITVTGTTPTTVSVTNTSDATLSSTVALGTLTPATGGTLATSTVQAQLRSNKAYTLSAQASGLTISGGGAADGGSSITLSDIGFGITAINATGANVTTGHTDTIVSLFNYGSGFPAVTNGLTPFLAGTNSTLNDITASTQILSGTRISAKGNIATNNNFVLVTFGIATLPQYFTPNSGFSTTVTLTIAAP
jgi:hypothetical protein